MSTTSSPPLATLSHSIQQQRSHKNSRKHRRLENQTPRLGGRWHKTSPAPRWRLVRSAQRWRGRCPGRWRGGRPAPRNDEAKRNPRRVGSPGSRRCVSLLFFVFSCGWRNNFHFGTLVASVLFFCFLLLWWQKVFSLPSSFVSVTKQRRRERDRAEWYVMAR